MVSFMYVSQNVLLFVFLVLFKVFLPEVEGSLLFWEQEVISSGRMFQPCREAKWFFERGGMSVISYQPETLL